ncbi:lipase family protein [Rhodococcus sp. IEGM 1351]|nr:lipase family protein [Rhodococcus sp. IEGM 1351]MDI9939145.1 lipase family protein [Rhodococcus sp. IEGM 1351]
MVLAGYSGAGYSGGGVAGGWAAAIAATCAPELKLAAVLQGGVPADLEQMAEGWDSTCTWVSGRGPAFAAAIGLDREYPTRLPVSSQLNETSLWLQEWMSNGCKSDAAPSRAQRSTDLSCYRDRGPPHPDEWRSGLGWP